MSPEGAGPGKDHGSGMGWLVSLVLVGGLIGAGVLVWHFKGGSGFGPAAEVSIAEYLELKANGQVREVHLEEQELSAALVSDFVRDGKHFVYIHVLVPPAYLVDARGFNELKWGIDPARFIVVHRRTWGCR
jgi:hypothetical protein